jgi:hypothetical protein
LSDCEDCGEANQADEYQERVDVIEAAQGWWLSFVKEKSSIADLVANFSILDSNGHRVPFYSRSLFARRTARDSLRNGNWQDWIATVGVFPMDRPEGLLFKVTAPTFAVLWREFEEAIVAKGHLRAGVPQTIGTRR